MFNLIFWHFQSMQAALPSYDFIICKIYHRILFLYQKKKKIDILLLMMKNVYKNIKNVPNVASVFIIG